MQQESNRLVEEDEGDKILHGLLYRWIYVKKMRTNSIDSSRKVQMWFPLLRHENVTEGCVSCSVFMGLEILEEKAFFSGQAEGEAGGRHLLK